LINLETKIESGEDSSNDQNDKESDSNDVITDSSDSDFESKPSKLKKKERLVLILKHKFIY
jgi:hypothetical protein